MAAGQTVAVLGRLPRRSLERLAAVLGSTGLLVAVHPAVRRAGIAAAIQALPDNTAMLSHAVDVVLLPPAVEAPDWGLLVEECRRIMAPHGWLAAALPARSAALLARELRSIPFRAVVEEPAGDLVQVRARGP